MEVQPAHRCFNSHILARVLLVTAGIPHRSSRRNFVSFGNTSIPEFTSSVTFLPPP